MQKKFINLNLSYPSLILRIPRETNGCKHIPRTHKVLRDTFSTVNVIRTALIRFASEPLRRVCLGLSRVLLPSGFHSTACLVLFNVLKVICLLYVAQYCSKKDCEYIIQSISNHNLQPGGIYILRAHIQLFYKWLLRCVQHIWPTKSLALNH